MKVILTVLRTLVWLLALGGAGYLAFRTGYKRYRDKLEAATATKAADKAPHQVIAIRVKPHDLRRMASLTGTVRPMAEVRIMSKVSGRLDELRLEDGTPIEQGTVIPRKGARIAMIDHEAFAAQVKQAEATVKALEAELARVNAPPRPEELAIAEANVRGAEAAVKAAEASVGQALAALENARSELKRIADLFAEKVATQQQLDNARAQAAIAEERHRAAGEQVRSAEQQLKAAREQRLLVEKGARQEDRDAVAAKILPAKAALDLAEINRKESTISAPIAGVVAIKHLDEGNMVSPGVPIVTLMDVETVKVLLGAPERELPFLRAGTTDATVRADAIPGEVFVGKVQKISPVVDERTRTVEVELHVANAGRRLKPGMFARVELVLIEKKGVPAIPEYAVTWLDDQAWVTVVSDGKARPRVVKLGLSEGPIVEVLEGVVPGELVIVRGQQGLDDGDMVVVTEEDATR